VLESRTIQAEAVCNNHVLAIHYAYFYVSRLANFQTRKNWLSPD